MKTALTIAIWYSGIALVFQFSAMLRYLGVLPGGPTGTMIAFNAANSALFYGLSFLSIWNVPGSRSLFFVASAYVLKKLIDAGAFRLGLFGYSITKKALGPDGTVKLSVGKSLSVLVALALAFLAAYPFDPGT